MQTLATNTLSLENRKQSNPCVIQNVISDHKECVVNMCSSYIYCVFVCLRARARLYVLNEYVNLISHRIITAKSIRYAKCTKSF